MKMFGFFSFFWLFSEMTTSYQDQPLPAVTVYSRSDYVTTSSSGSAVSAGVDGSISIVFDMSKKEAGNPSMNYKKAFQRIKGKNHDHDLFQVCYHHQH
jgi:hypothetical protein